MGVQGLWELLAPVGRRVSVETLSGKRLAVDASIWMIQFMKAMRDEKGEMVRNAHLIGFFRRICKLLYLRTKPVFVFDGGTPALKRRTVMARRRQRENAQAKIRKTAEKLLLNRLKDMRLKEQVENQRRPQKSDAMGTKRMPDEPRQSEERDSARRADGGFSGSQQEKLDEMLAASIEAEKYGSLASGVDEVEKRLVKTDPKGKRVLLDGSDLTNKEQNDPERDNTILMKDYQEKLDEMLAASIAAEEDGKSTNNASTSAAAIPSEEEGSDEDEQMLLPAMHGNVDPAVLASLPPSVQLELLVQMRERLMAENRQKYQKVKKTPEKFSELQVQAYLKTVAFRREIDEVQKASAGRGVGGVQTSRIASEANREFIFSSSFTGDKEVLASARAEGNAKKQENTSKHSLAGSVKSVASLNKSDAAAELDVDEPRNPDEDIEVYIDERGRLRIRNRHMGIPMTRDIQRNLDLMKEKERATINSVSNNDEMASAWENFPREDQFLDPLPGEKGESVILNDGDKDSMLQDGSPIEISFEDNGNGGHLDDDDDIFVRLAAGTPMTISSADNNPKEESSLSASDSDWEEMPIEQQGSVSKLHANSSNSKEESSPCASDSDWEEMPVEQKISVSKVDANSNNQNIPQETNKMDKIEAEGEQTTCRDPNYTEDNIIKRFSKGYLEEEADLQEAIKRSLLDLDGKKSVSMSSECDVMKTSGVIHGEKNQKVGVDLVINEVTQHNLPFRETVRGVEEDGTLDRITVSKTSGSLNQQSNTSLVHNADGQRGIAERFDAYISSRSENIGHDVSHERKLNKETSQAKTVNLPEKLPCNDSNELSTMSKGLTEDSSHALGGVPVQLHDMAITDEDKNDSPGEASFRASAKEDNVEGKSSIMLEDKRNAVECESCSLMTEIREPSNAALESRIQRPSYDTDLKQRSREEKNSSENAHKIDSPSNFDKDGLQVEFTEANLEEEMLILGQEFMSLGDEQRRLERNAESVSSEMFAECQELLQIFGLPYIIAPMEAEAQCAFMELSNLVDGVITDDSDVFLFGARSVYKNIFDDRKYVETYFMKDIEKELGLTREKLVRMALLLGSDYTEGVSGIGIVNAIEVVNAFPEDDGLQKFREWVESPDPTILGKTNSKTGSNTKTRGSTPIDLEGASIDDTKEIKQIFMEKHRNVSKNWHIPATFPSEAVISAYSSPQVDRSTEPFLWGKPDLLVLRKLCWEKFGWNSQKTDDLLLPVLKEYEKRETQLRMEAFYSFNERFAKIRSKRIRKAVKGITGNESSEVTDDTLLEASRSRKKKRVAPPESGDNISDKDSTKAESGKENHRNPLEKSPARKTRKNGNQERQNSTRSLEGNKRGRGRGRAQRRGRGRGQKGVVSEPSESSSDIDNSGDDLQEHHDVEPGTFQKVRRSTRSRNPVTYNMNEDDELDKLPGNEECPSEKLEEEFPGVEDRLADTSAECGGGKHNETAEKLIKDCPSEDDFQMGGGFCVDEAEIGEPSTGHSDDPHLENKSNDDYLVLGGGFCADEDETVEDQNTDFTRDDSSGGFDSVDKSNSNRLQSIPRENSVDAVKNLDHQTGESKDKRAGEDQSLKENVEIDVGTSSAGALSAMPFLKRKRRRGG